jgi:hypothetical protein
MKKIMLLVSILFILFLSSCNATAPAASPTPTPTFAPSITWTPTMKTTLIPTWTETATNLPKHTYDLTYAYEAYHRKPVEQISYSLECKQNRGSIKCHDTLLGMSFEYSQDLWKDILPKLEWGGDNGYEYSYFIDSSPDWPIAGGRSRIYSEGREPVIFDLGTRDSANTEEDICGWFSAAACIKVKPNVYLAIRSSDGTQCESIPISIYWGWWYPEAVIAVKLRDQSIINAFTFASAFLSAEDLAKPYSFLSITDNAPTVCEKRSMEKYSQFFMDLIQGHWDNVSNEARIKFEKMAHLAESIEFDK